MYQGGIVPGNSLRVVDIEGIDTEACCGTHVDNTAEIGWIKILKTTRVSDGVVWLYYVAGERAMEELNKESTLLFDMCKLWGVDNNQLLTTGKWFFNDHKKHISTIEKQDKQILGLQMKCTLSGDSGITVFDTAEDSPTIYFSFLPAYAHNLKEKGKGIIFITETFLIGILGNP